MEKLSALAAAVDIARGSEVERVGSALVAALAESCVPNGGNGRERRISRSVKEARRRAACALVSRWEELSRELRSEALRMVGAEGPDAAGELSSSPRASVRASAIRYIADRGEPALLPVVLKAILDDDAGVGASAEETLVFVVQTCTGNSLSEFGVKPRMTPVGGGFTLSEVQERGLCEGVAALCEAYLEHRRKGVLAAAIGLLNLGRAASRDGGLGRWLADGLQAGHPALRSMLRRGAGAMSRRRAWEWLLHPGFAGAAEERLGRAESAAELVAALEQSHLLENPKRQAKVEHAAQRRQFPLVPTTAETAVPARRGLARVVGGNNAEQAAAFLTDKDAAVRLGAVRVLPASSVLDFCFDGHPDVAAAAVTRWWHEWDAEQTERRRVARNLGRSPHERVRWIAQELLAAQRGSESLDRIRETLRSGSAPERLAAIQDARHQGLQRAVEPDLMEFLGSTQDTPQAAGAAVSALVESGSNSAFEVVERCLAHSVPRVRANAAEGMVRRSLGQGDLAVRSPRLYDSLIEMKTDESHRVRSSAVRAMLRAASPEWGGTGFEPAAADELVKMLEDERPMHRVAGLWAVEHAAMGESVARRWDRIASLVAKLASEEVDDAVQRRAAWCARRMLAAERAREVTQEISA